MERKGGEGVGGGVGVGKEGARVGGGGGGGEGVTESGKTSEEEVGKGKEKEEESPLFDPPPHVTRLTWKPLKRPSPQRISPPPARTASPFSSTM